MSLDPRDHREASPKPGKRPPPGWARRQEPIRTCAAPVSRWMIDAVAPQPGDRVLELAAGLGETGFLAAELVLPGGS